MPSRSQSADTFSAMLSAPLEHIALHPQVVIQPATPRDDHELVTQPSLPPARCEAQAATSRLIHIRGAKYS